MGVIIAIGGGEIPRVALQQKVDDSETLAIDREILRCTGKKHPRLLFIPTASGDAEGYCDNMRSYFSSLGARVAALCVTKNDMHHAQIKKAILSADAIYVGGGNTLKMMMIWRRLGIDKILWQAYRKGIVLSGISAGAICWFDCGNSDSRHFTSGSEQFIKVTGLGMINALCCPHFDSEPQRQHDLERMMRTTTRIVAIALDDGAALQVIDDAYRVVTGKTNVAARVCFWHRGQYITRLISISSDLRSLDQLLRK